MTDFSHLFSDIYPSDLVAYLAAKGERITDEILLEIFNRISPPLLGPRETAMVVALVSRKRGRRPSRGVPSLQWLSKQIAKIERPDVHDSFIGALSKRIASPKGFTQLDRDRQLNREWKRRDRNLMIRGLYRRFYVAIKNSPPTIHNETLGEIEVPLQIKGRRQRAAKMTAEVLRKRLKMTAPSTDTIIKIASMIH